MEINSIEKQVSKGIQIIAVLMMVFHHTFGFHERYMEGISYIGITIGSVHVEQFIGSMCKICVSLFVFGTGYAFAHKKLTLQYIWKKISSLLIIYWVSILLFELTKYIGGTIDSVQNIIKNITMYTFNINVNAWYLSFYIFALLILFILQKINAKKCILLVFIPVCLLANYVIDKNNYILPFSLNSFFIYFPLVLFGYYLNSTLFNKIYNFLCNSEFGMLLSFILLIITFILRVFTGSVMNGFRFIWIYGPILYLALAVIIKYLLKYKLISKFISFSGSYTTEFWLFHGLFTSPVLWIQSLCFMPKISILVFIWEIILTFVIAHSLKLILSIKIY